MNADSRQRALDWLQQYGVSPDSLTPMSGYTNHVFLVTQSDSAYPQRSVLRLADFSLSAELCPLAHEFAAVSQKHVAAAELGLSPGVIAADKVAGAMWLEYAGQRRKLGLPEFAKVGRLLGRLHGSGANRFDDEAYTGVQVSSLYSLLQDLSDELRNGITPSKAFATTSFAKGKQEGVITDQLEALVSQGQQRGYFQYSLVPIHGDLNPGNLLHDGQRWWLIDWDFAAMGIREWDMAGLIVEHDWDVTRAQQLVPDMPLADIQWFCSCFALLSWYWHLQRESGEELLAAKWQTMRYWLAPKR